MATAFPVLHGSNNTNKLSPQEQYSKVRWLILRSNNTNKLSPQELYSEAPSSNCCSNNTNKLSPQERCSSGTARVRVQIIQINLVLKNRLDLHTCAMLCSNNTNKLSPQERYNTLEN